MILKEIGEGGGGWGYASGLKVYMECGIPIIIIGITGLRERLGRDEGFEAPYSGPPKVLFRGRKGIPGSRVTPARGLP